MTENNTCCMTRPVSPAEEISSVPANTAGKLRAYVPLVAMTGVALAEGAVLHAAWNLPLMTTAMGIWLIQFALVKLFDLNGFVDRFARYDLVTRRMRIYGMLFPFIELALGLAYLGRYVPMLTSCIMLVVATASLVGVVSAMRRNEKLSCACMGASVDVPLSFIAVVENGLMIAMASVILLGH